MTHNIYHMPMQKIYDLYVQKLQRKHITADYVQAAMIWLTGYSAAQISQQLERQVSVQAFFAQAPKMNPKAKQITGRICGVVIQEIQEPLMQQIRYLDKLIDDLYKGKKIDKVLF